MEHPDKGGFDIIVKDKNYRSSKRVKYSPTEVLLCDGVPVHPGEKITTIIGASDFYTKCVLMAAWAGEHVTLIDEVVKPGYVIGARDNFMSIILSDLAMPKWQLLNWYCSPMIKPVKPEAFFKKVEPNKLVRNITLLAATRVGIPVDFYKYWVGGSYISTTPTPVGMINLVKKMCPRTQRWNVHPNIMTIGYALFIQNALKDSQKHKFKWDRKTISRLRYKAASGIGFPYCPDVYGVKQKKDTIQHCRDRYFALCDLLSTGEPIFKHKNPGVNKSLFKPEIRGPEDPVGKARYIGQEDMETEMMQGHLSTAAMTELTKCPWFGPGHSAASSMIPNLLFALGHPEYENYKDVYKNCKFEAGPKVAGYLKFDINGQDWSYIMAMLHLAFGIRYAFWDYDKMDVRDRRVFAQISHMCQIAIEHKLVQWFDGDMYLQRGAVTSGNKWTSGSGCIYTMYAFIIAVAICLKEHYEAWWHHVHKFRIMIYGDDGVVRVPMDMIHILCSNTEGDKLVPDKLISAFKLMGVTLKASDTFILMPTPVHEDRFFTTVENDVVKHEGLTFLQKKFVKVGPNNRPIHHSIMKWFKIGTWRPTKDLLIKSANHEFNWDHPSKNISVALMQKCFGLIYDAAYNETAHNYLREIMRLLETTFPGCCEWATVAMDLAELKIKVPSVEQSHIRRILSKDSFDFVTSHLTVDMKSAWLRCPSKVIEINKLIG